MTESVLRTSLLRSGLVTTLHASGELDLDTAPDLKDAALAALAGSGGELHVDLNQVTFIDSSGASTLLALHKRAANQGWRMVLVSPTPSVLRAIESLSLDQVFNIQPAERSDDDVRSTRA